MGLGYLGGSCEAQTKANPESVPIPVTVLHRILFVCARSKLFVLRAFYGAVIRLLLPLTEPQGNQHVKTVAWTAVSNSDNSLKGSGNKMLREKSRKPCRFPSQIEEKLERGATLFTVLPRSALLPFSALG